jgi:hypothetical protein
MTTRTLTKLIALGVSLLVVSAADPKIILGALEEIPGHYAGQPSFRAVRVLFQKHGREWKPFPRSCPNPDCLKVLASEYPSAATWTIALSGRRMGEVTGATPKEFESFADIGLQPITSKDAIPTIGKRSSEYGGFTGSSVFRPQIANSQPYFKDTDSWKPSGFSTEVTSALRSQFRKKFPKVSNCTSQDDSTAKPWLYRDTEIKVAKAYSSIQGWSVVQMLLAEFRCEGPPEDALVNQWFVVTPGGEIRFLGAGMWLVDFGDYDNDGKSEVVFSIDRYNQGGYELFYDDFKKSAVFQFSYH